MWMTIAKSGGSVIGSSSCHLDPEIVGQSGDSVVVALSDGADLPCAGPAVELEEDDRPLGRQLRDGEHEVRAAFGAYV